MIKVNLLDSVTERARTAAVVERRVANPRTRSWMLLGSVVSVMLLAMLVDYVSATSAQRAANEELERQKQIAVQTAAINKEQAELEKKIKDIQARIDVIKKLRAAQQGPVGALSAINDRLARLPDFRLESVEQKDGELTISGYSPSEQEVTNFARSLEFSDNNFTNMSIETQRSIIDPSNVDVKMEGGAIDPSKIVEQVDPKLFDKMQMVTFKIKCKYTPGNPNMAPPAAAAPAGQPAAPQVAQK